ncbi:hypothetical protein Tco_0067197 [Tanacetum coccineum]
MFRANPQAAIVSEEQLLPRDNRFKITKNNQRIASNSNIANSFLRLVSKFKQYKLYKPISLTEKVPVIYMQQFWTTLTHNSSTNAFPLTSELLRIVLQMQLNVTNKPFTILPTENELLSFIKTMGYDEDPKQKMTIVSHFIATRLYQPWRAILSVLNRSLTGNDTSFNRSRLPMLQILWGIDDKPTKQTKLIYPRFTELIINYFLSTNKSIPRRSNADMHSEEHNSFLSKLIKTVDGEFKFGIEIPDTMINDTIKQSAGYKVYQSKKKKSEEDDAQEESKEQNMSTVGRGRGQGYMHLGNQEVNVSSKPKKDIVPRRKRTITYADNLLETEDEVVLLAKSVSIEEQRRQQQRIMTQLVIEKDVNTEVEEAFAAKIGKKLKGIATEDPVVQSLLDLWKGSKESRLESIRQDIQTGKGEGSSAVKDGEIEYFSNTDSDATTSSSWSSDKDDAEDSDMDISNDNSNKGDDDADGFGVFMYDKSKELPKFTPSLPRKPVFTDARTTFVVANPEGNPEVTCFLSGASEVPFGTKMFKQLTLFIGNFEDVADLQVSSPPATTTHNLQLHSILFKSIPLDQEYLNAQDTKSTLRKRPHNDQDSPNDREGEKKSKRRKDARESSSKSSKNDKALIDSVQDDILTRNGFLRSRDEDCILGLSVVTVAKKIKELIKKDELTIVNLEAVLEEAQWSDGDNDLTKPRSFEKLMSKIAKPNSCFYNSDFYYLVYVSMEKKYTSPLTKHHSARYYIEGIEDMISDRWSKEVHLYHVNAPNGIHHWDDMRKDFFKAEMGNRSTHKVYSGKRIITAVSVDVKMKWGYDFLTSIKVKRIDNKEYEFSYKDLSRLSLNDIEDMYLLKVQGKLHHLKLDYEIDFINALLLYIRRVVIKNRIKDIQLGIDHKIPYTTTGTENGVVYLNKYDVKSLMQSKEVHEFCDGTLLKVQDNLLKMLNENKLGHGNVKLEGSE